LIKTCENITDFVLEDSSLDKTNIGRLSAKVAHNQFDRTDFSGSCTSARVIPNCR